MRQYPIPAVGVVIEQNGKVLLIQKGRGIFENQWCIPGGKIKIGEEIFDTVRRESFEETCLVVDSPEFVGYQQTIEYDSDGKVTRHFVFFDFKAQYISGSPKAGDDAKNIGFFDISELHSLSISAPTIKTLKLLGIM
jgi:ADP-ribose pyrophosphatase YjhB (NUDIX family)